MYRNSPYLKVILNAKCIQEPQNAIRIACLRVTSAFLLCLALSGCSVGATSVTPISKIDGGSGGGGGSAY